MIYQDQMYGVIELPDYVQRICATPEFERLADISQDVLPQCFVPWGVPSRKEHCLGVYCLATLVAQNLGLSEQKSKLLCASALLHDAGNPALSHLSEPFLHELEGKDGESFLEDRLRKTETEGIIQEQGLSLYQVVGFVTGNTKPLSVVLHGSMDIDNLDNVGRYWFVAKNSQKLFNATSIASAFKYENGGWFLPRELWQEAERWQQTRASVYKMIYGVPHLNLAMMIYRALSVAFHRGEIRGSFFHLSDSKAIDFLLDCNDSSYRLVDEALNQRWYQEVCCFETTTPSEKFKKLTKRWNQRDILASSICSRFDVPDWVVCAYIGVGRDKRRIELPFVDADGRVYYDSQNHDPLYRLKVYLHQEFLDRAPQVREFLGTLV